MRNSSRIGREKILDVAENLFTENGYRAVSIRDIAQACGVTNAALYYHFASKEALFAEVLEQHADRLRARMMQAAEGVEEPREQIVAMLTEYAAFAAERRSPLFLLRHRAAGLSPEQARQHHVSLIGRILQPLEDRLASLIQSGELRPLPEGYSPASLLLGMLHGLVQHRRAVAAAPVDHQAVRLLVDIFWDGMARRK